MTIDSRYDILFEPVKIGPVTAPNRFFQTPHGNGHGFMDPRGNAAWRGVRAEGGWGVVNTEQCEIHPSSESRPLSLSRIFDDHDIPALELMTQAVHEHGALAGVELCYNGLAMANLYSRDIPMGPSSIPIITEQLAPVQSRAMDKNDIKNLLRWQKNAALRAKKAGFDLVYVYAAHLLGLPFMFLSHRYNHRTDEYGGKLENRARLLKQMIEVTRDAVGDICAVPVRISVDELMGSAGLEKAEVEDLFESLGEMPDLWDLTLSDWSNDSPTSRFIGEGHEEPFVANFNKLTSKPIVGVGRFTSPDTMVSQVRRGVLDLVGAARPSIADPFLPNKIREGQGDEIRECIGCNICIAYESSGTPARCTQNPTAGEEWRRGWHPERIAPARSESGLLIVGAGPAGLEAALAAGQRGYPVILAEATRTLGGRVAQESLLPNLSTWGRVADYRITKLQQMMNVDIHLDNELSADDIMLLETPHVVIATGASWRRDGVGRYYLGETMPIEDGSSILTPDDIMIGENPVGKNVVVYDDDFYYMGNVIAEKLALEGYTMTIVTSSHTLSPWSELTMETSRIYQRMNELSIRIVTGSTLSQVSKNVVTVKNITTDGESLVDCDSVVLVTARNTNSSVYDQLSMRKFEWKDAGIQDVQCIGDCLAPGTIAAAVYSGHRYAQEIDEKDIGDAVPFKRPLVDMINSG